MSQLQAAAPSLKSKIDGDIQRLLAIADQFDPLALLSTAAGTLLFHDPDEHDSGHDIGEVQMEHLFSLYLARPYATSRPLPPPIRSQECLDILKDLHGKFAVYYHTVSTEGNELGTDLRINTHYVRGEAYTCHFEKQFLELGAMHDGFLRDRFGFDSAELLSLLHYARAQINDQFQARRERFWSVRDQLVRLHNGIEGDLAPTELFDRAVVAVNDSRFRENNKTLCSEFMSLVDNPSVPEVFGVRPRHDADAKLLDLIAARFGDNADFLSIAAWAGWPLNPSIIQRKPFLYHDGQYYLFVGPLAFRNVLGLLEGIIHDADEAYWSRRFLPQRDEYVERTTIDLVTQMLPGCHSYRNAYYETDLNGRAERTEVDGLVLYDDALLVIEVKAGKFSAEARRGAPKRLERDLAQLLGRAFSRLFLNRYGCSVF